MESSISFKQVCPTTGLSYFISLPFSSSSSSSLSKEAMEKLLKTSDGKDRFYLADTFLSSYKTSRNLIFSLSLEELIALPENYLAALLLTVFKKHSLFLTEPNSSKLSETETAMACNLLLSSCKKESLAALCKLSIQVNSTNEDKLPALSFRLDTYTLPPLRGTFDSVLIDYTVSLKNSISFIFSETRIGVSAMDKILEEVKREESLKRKEAKEKTTKSKQAKSILALREELLENESFSSTISTLELTKFSNFLQRLSTQYLLNIGESVRRTAIERLDSIYSVLALQASSAESDKAKSLIKQLSKALETLETDSFDAIDSVTASPELKEYEQEKATTATKSLKEILAAKKKQSKEKGTAEGDGSILSSKLSSNSTATQPSIRTEETEKKEGEAQ